MRVGNESHGQQMKKSDMMTNKSLLLLFCTLLVTSCASGNSSEGLGALPKAVGAADETSAIQSLRTISTAEAQLRASRGSYGDFDALVQGGFLDERFAGVSPNVKGYRFTISANDSEFAVSADPQTTETQSTTGSRHFYLDSSGTVHFNLKEAASKNDPVI